MLPSDTVTELVAAVGPAGRLKKLSFQELSAVPFPNTLGTDKTGYKIDRQVIALITEWGGLNSETPGLSGSCLI